MSIINLNYKAKKIKKYQFFFKKMHLFESINLKENILFRLNILLINLHLKIE